MFLNILRPISWPVAMNRRQNFSPLFTMAATDHASNDGGIVIALFLMALTISYALSKAVDIFEVCKYHNNNQDKQKTNVSPGKLSWLRAQMLAWNLGNSMTHILLVVYMKANEITIPIIGSTKGNLVV